MLACAAMKIRPVLFAALALSCTHASPQAETKAAAAPASKLAEFADAYYAASFARGPSRATRVGFHEYDMKLEDLSRAATESRIAELRNELQQLQAVRAGQLSFDDEIDA